MTTIEKNTKITNHICRIYWNLASDIASLVKTSNFTAVISFLTGSWTEIYITPPAQLDEKSESGFSGQIIKSTITFHFPGEESTNAEAFAQLLGRGLVLRLVYDNGTEKLLGTKDNPVYLEMKNASSPTAGFNFSGEITDLEQNYWL
jgi:hypothetical protein